MKASIKFRDERNQKPLFRAKVPLNILGFPFQSGIVAGDSKELSLNLSTFFESGPSVKVSYRPNDSINPFSLIFKTGISHFGSPNSSPMSMSAEFNLVAGQNPSFFVNFKPQFGDFTIKKTQSSSILKRQCVSIDDGGPVLVESPVIKNYLPEGGKVFAVLPLDSPAAGVVKDVFSDVEVSARTSVPLRKHASLNFRWGVRFPAEEGLVVKSNNHNPLAAWMSFDKLPRLVMNKIGIEHVAMRHDSEVKEGQTPLAEERVDVKRQLEIIRSENGMLRKSMDDLKSEFLAAKNKLNYRGGGEMGEKKLNGYGGKAMEGVEVNERSNKKGLKSTTSAS